MLANKHSFPSDLCISLMGLNGSVIVADQSSEIEIKLNEFVNMDMSKKIIKQVCIPLGVINQKYMTNKV